MESIENAVLLSAAKYLAVDNETRRDASLRSAWQWCDDDHQSTF